MDSTVVGPLFPRSKRDTKSYGNAPGWSNVRSMSQSYHDPYEYSPVPPMPPTPLSLARPTSSSLIMPPRNVDPGLSSTSSASDGENQARHAPGPGKAKPTQKRIRPSTEHRREQCHLNQARYRDRQRKRSVYNVIVEYFHLFRHGVDVSRGCLQSDATQRQQVFLRYSMAPNDLGFRLDHMSELSKGLIVVSASIRVTITKETLNQVFPRLSGGRHGSRTGEQQDFKAVSLGVKLLLLPSTLYFEWDRVTMQVVRLEMAVDFLTPLRREFGNLEDASFVLDGANIAPDSAIRYSCKCLMDQGSGRMLYMYLRTQLIGTMAKF
ncbi:hypothetical protein PHYSODRAFT_336732 [Phytophthora sojae]|uniref:Uncharacterized protein n=1 Tax=Phytophthora sojae (strain P6497) TaxID=1094619 RepID=G4ZVW3_PHYSP|nr:hypothetical protein PHYSODRAFT_336732 [Phytophthora sojae]EGZ12299.1 hypothetical protein PHYSODRAFT_336732 [Phytophthora sojae]|eukprot:XP_009532632.1 hypothetical protein PHYSODRAFT_336732 [Phytophthora sojae]